VISKNYLAFLVLFLSTTSLFAQTDLILTEIMFSPSVNGTRNEFVEIYNPTAQTKDLLDYQIGVAGVSDFILVFSGSTLLAPNSYGVIVEGDYDSNDTPYSIPGSAIIVKIDDNAFGSSGMANTSDREVYLINGVGDTVSTYTYSANNSAGISDEKIILNNDNTSSNWANSLVLNGTPGSKNSVAPTELDVAVTNISTSPSPAVEGDLLTADVKVLNNGTLTASSFDLKLYNDANLNSIGEAGELIDNFTINNLASGDSIVQQFDVGSLVEGSYQLIGIAELAGDEATFNDTLLYNFDVLPPPPPFNAININEIMYAPSTGQPEWIEIYNRSANTYNLAGWKFADAANEVTITTDPITIAPDEFIVISANSSIEDFFNISSTIIVTSLPALNNTGDRAVLKDNNSFIVDSLTYTSSWGGTSGRSLERIDYDSPSHDQTNWGTSVSPNNATPGDVNSLAPKNFDLSVTSLNVTPFPLIENTTLTSNITVKNIGKNTADTYTVRIYNDENFDLTPQAGELIASANLSNLASGDSVIQNLNIGSFSAGALQLIALVVYASDENNDNNELIEEFTVNYPPPLFNSVLINEIMYAPASGQPEWIEIYNRSSSTYNMANWKFADAGTTVNITVDPITIAPGEFIVLARSETVSDFFDINSTIIVFNLPALNNTGDKAILMDGTSLIIDSLTYTSSWGGTSGRSLERIDYDSPSHDQSNWGTSVSPNNATPGDVNSLAPKDFDLAVTSLTVTPFPLIENTNLTAQVKVKNLGNNSANTFVIRLYNDENFDSTPQPGELINSFNHTNLADGDSLTQNFSIGSFSAGNLQLIALVEFASDEDNTNNELIAEFDVNQPPPPFNSVVINEIMYTRPSGSEEPEWIEIYNRSSNSYSLANWKFSDASLVDPVIITVDPIIIEPGEFVVLAKDETISDYFDIDAKIIVFNLPALNDPGDRAVLLDGTSSIIDSLTFKSSWGGTGGRSLERIDYDSPSYDQENWGTSVSSNRATPGSVNSLAPKEFDLSLSSISISPQPVIESSELTANVLVENRGQNSANTFIVRLYNDINYDSTPQPEELIDSYTRGNLAPGDSLVEQFNLGAFNVGNVQLIGLVVFGAEEDNSNNELIYEFTVFPPPPDYNDIVINEIMYAPSSGQPEWVEIFNRSETSYLLTNWQLGDATSSSVITTLPTIIEPGEYIVLTKDSSIVNFYSIPSKIIEMNLPALNNPGDDVVLLNENLFVIDSLSYTSAWGGSTGKSLERIDVNLSSTLQSNWSESIDPKGGTPGKDNSVIPREFDLAITYFNSTDSFLFVDEISSFKVNVLNLGTSSIQDAALNVYLDLNSDEFFTEDEIIAQFTQIDFEANQEISREFNYTFGSIGNISMLAVINHLEDTYPTNDSLFLQKEVVKPNVERGQIVINEFMYAPTAPYPEWIEIYNSSATAFQLRDFKIADLNDTVTISTQNILLQPDSYLVISRDSIITQLYDIPSQVIVRSFPTLNNSGDRIMLLDNYTRIIDSLEYSSTWGGTGGKSLERINPFGNSSDQSNWVTSTDPSNGTPGRLNSSAPKDYDVAVIDFYSNPQQPIIGEPVTFSIDLANLGLNIASFVVSLYESNTEGDKLNLLETLQVENLIAGNWQTYNFNYRIESFEGEKFFIAEANYEVDQDFSNNSSLLFVSSAAAPLSIIINEIMFNPQDDEPEWIELYNNSTNTINLRDWQVSDVITNPVSTTIIRENFYIEPGKFVVLSKDSGIFGYHPNLSEDVILLNFATLNNTDDGVVIYNRFSETIDSVFYNNQFSKRAGHSIERLDYDGSSIDPANWNYSISPQRGTPGFINSRIPKNYDLLVDSLFIQPTFPELGDEISISMYITNNGLFEANQYTVIFEADFGVYEEFQGQTLAAGQTDLITVSSYFQMQKSFTAKATIVYALDEDQANNSLTKTFYSGYSPSSVLINEVLYAPASDGTEWVELINATNTSINIKDWKIAEGSTYNSPRTITDQDITILPGEYIIVADDTSGGKFQPMPGVHIFQVDFGTMNTTEDIVTIFDFRGALIDSLKYFSSWGAGAGISLERISLALPTNDRSNWLPSIMFGGSTPGIPNSTVNVTPIDEKKIVINEIMFNPETDNSEFIEFFNTSDEFIEIANWIVADESNNRTNLSRTSFVVSPKSYFIVAGDSSILINYPELSAFNQLIIANRNLSLNNSDDLVIITDAFGNTVDSVHYENSWHNQKTISTRNKSLERINPFLDGNDNNNWSTSVASEGATPGKSNSIFIDNKSSNKTISVTPNPFSPDGDGYEDFVIINYNLPREVTSIQIKVFDSKGRKVRTINEDNIWGSQGSIIFDGYSDDGQPLKIGIYILFIEALNSASGTTDTFKEVVVVARKL